VRRFMIILLAAIAASVFVVPTASAGSPHFVGATTVIRSGNSLTVHGTEAGLDTDAQIQVSISVLAACLNGGGHLPDIASTKRFRATATFAVHNGEANLSLTVTAAFQPKCSPPMSVAFGAVTVIDLTNRISVTLPGTL
jgi:hypothetical protein